MTRAIDAGHFPIIDTPNTLLDLLFFACGVELQNATCVWSYQPTKDNDLVLWLAQAGLTAVEGLRSHDLSQVDSQTRYLNVLSRGRMQDLLRVVSQQVVVKDSHGTVQDLRTFLFLPMLAWLIHALKAYYERSHHTRFRGRSPPPSLSDEEQIGEYPFPDQSLFHRQLCWVAARHSGLPQEVAKLRGSPVDNLIRPPPTFTLTRKPELPHSSESSSHRAKPQRLTQTSYSRRYHAVA